MKILIVLAVAAIASASPARYKRNVGQFGSMISCMTAQGLFRSWRDYDGYGCYCGLGGTGTPLDETDECCVTHDNCYDDVMKSGKCPYESHVYLVLYKYTTKMCNTGRAAIACAPADDYRLTDSPWPECAAAMCECDANGAKCFAQASDTYNKNYKDWPQENC
ncbi:acidic phospholipase A2 homolog [Anneissia japonica]|uniref:acidic phospholipase A2 homolog n=1 Tax=Anneissia japonica TaxID=1529436 RepID=UPI00142592B4|nr:acidic phospholipase A2 homolog [Anneissia japonica]